MSCTRKEAFLSHYLFDNGKACDPEKLRVRLSEPGKFFKKTSKGFFYHSKELFTLNGAAVTNLSNVDSFNAFVLVPPNEKFIDCSYQEAFDEIVLKLKDGKRKLEEKDQKQRSTSAPAVASFCGESVVTIKSVIQKEECKPKKSACESKKKVCVRSERESEKSSCKPSIRGSDVASMAHRHCVSSDKYPCCDQDSDDEINEKVEVEVAENKCKSKRSTKKRKSRNSSKAKKPAKKGFFASCCSCLIKKSKPVPCPDPMSRPSSNCGNGKTTQTSADDFKRAKKCLKMSIEQEKRRLKMYRRNKKKPIDKFECTREEPKMCIDGVEVEPSQRDLMKKEADYKKTREKYLEKRQKMEKKISKALAKEAKFRPKC